MKSNLLFWGGAGASSNISEDLAEAPMAMKMKSREVEAIFILFA